MTSTSIARRPQALTELPLSPLQARWWEVLRSYAGMATPIVSLIHRLRGPLDVAAWLRAVDALADRHEILRVRIVERAGTPVQLVLPPAGLTVDRIDLTDLPDAERTEVAQARVNEHRQAVNDPASGPLVRSCLVRLSDVDHVWSLTMHHILADGASMSVVDRDLGLLYQAEVDGSPAGLPELAVHYPDYAVWQDGRVDPVEVEDIEYWRHQLAGLPPLELAADAAARRKGGPAAELVRVLDADLLRSVEELARAQRCTRYMLLLAATQALFGQVSGQDDFGIGIPVRGADRTRPELAEMVGVFSNAVVVRCDLRGDPTFRELLAQTRGSLLDALDHQAAPFGRVVPVVDPQPHPDRAQVYQAGFSMDESAAAPLELPGIVVEPFPLPMPKVLHDVTLLAWSGQDGLTIRFAYDTGVLDRDRVDMMATLYERILRSAVTDPDTPLSRLTDG